ncbi:hypothetical protein FQN54_003708 [Arachnomyces sp. PD_36]|nr:hypothetical protein FQN54_003708 [Arachnomyces sp. PD_36]
MSVDEKTSKTDSNSEPERNGSIVERGGEIVKEDKAKDEGGDTEESADDRLDHIAEDEFPSMIRLMAILVALVFSMFLASLDLTIISTAIPKITNQFHSLEDVGWYGSAMFFPVAATQSMWGKAFKYFPMKYMYLLSIFVFELGSLICATAPNSNAFIAGRAITGAGCAGTFAGSYVIIAFSSRPNIRPALTSILSATFALAAVVGPLIGGAFTQRISWRWCFYINLPFGGVAAAAIFFAFRPPRSAKPIPATVREKILQMDLIGVTAICGAVVCFVFAMQWGGVAKSWNNSDVIGTLVAFGLLIIIFVVDQWYQRDRALVMTSFLKNRTLLVGSVFSFFIAGGFYVALFYLPIYFQAVKGADAVQSGIRLIPLILGMTLIQIVVGVMITVTGIFNPYLTIGGALTAVGSGLLMMLDVDTGSPKWIGYQIVAGAGVGFCLSVPIIVSQRVVKPQDMSTATAIILFFQSIGGALVISAAQSIFQNKLVDYLIEFAPKVNPLAVVAAGATDIAGTFPEAVIPGILKAYVHALRITYAIAIPFAGVAAIVSLFMPWFKYTQPEAQKSKPEGEDLEA